MQFSNDDMDQLFREAADKYPLKTDNADWDKVASRLDEKTEEKPFAFSFGKIAGISLPVLLLISLFVFRNETNKEEVKHDEQNQNVKSISSASVQKTNVLIPRGKTISEQTIANTTVDEKIAISLRSVPVKMSASGGTSQPADLSSKTIMPLNNVSAKNENKQQSIENNNSEKNSSEKQHEAANVSGEEKEVSVKKEENKTESTAKTIVIKNSSKQNRFYINALTGLDKSHVAMQKFSGWGNQFGLTVGYNINSHFSIEAGVLSSKKEYYTGAQYFNTSKLGYSSSVKWKDFEGECRMLEIPVVVRYNFDAAGKMQWFASTGVSSYLVKNENYEYNYELYGQQKTGYHSYTNGSKNWMSAVHLSAGTELRLQKKSSFRIEPYIRVPLKKMGYGDIPISSAGLNIGYRYNLF